MSCRISSSDDPCSAGVCGRIWVSSRMQNPPPSGDPDTIWGRAAPCSCLSAGADRDHADDAGPVACVQEGVGCREDGALHLQRRGSPAASILSEHDCCSTCHQEYAIDYPFTTSYLQTCRSPPGTQHAWRWSWWGPRRMQWAAGKHAPPTSHPGRVGGREGERGVISHGVS